MSRRLPFMGWALLAAMACAGGNAKETSGTRAAAAAPQSCDDIEREYSKLSVQTPCATAADCTDERSRSLICFWGPVKTNVHSQEGAQLPQLERAFQEKHCSAAPCTPPTGTPVTSCTRGVCTTELVR